MENKIAAQVRELAEPVVNDYGVELVDVEYLREMHGWVIRLLIDKEGGVTLHDCAAVSREVGNLLEIKEVIMHPYHLEVSSPGIERPLKRENDFERFAGKEVLIRTADLLMGRRNFKGTLRGISQGCVHLEMEGTLWEIPYSSIRQAKVTYESTPKA
jgi:ribosome maturation factor RimP